MIHKIEEGQRTAKHGLTGSRVVVQNKFPTFTFTELPLHKDIWTSLETEDEYEMSILCGFAKGIVSTDHRTDSRYITWEIDSTLKQANFYLMFYTPKRSKQNPTGRHYRKMFSIPFDTMKTEIEEFVAEFTAKGCTMKILYKHGGRYGRRKVYKKYTPVTFRRKKLIYPTLKKGTLREWHIEFDYSLK